jgi:hypothetical protein
MSNQTMDASFPLVPLDVLQSHSPSRKHGMDWELEVKCRRQCARVIRDVGGPTYLKL